MAELFTLQGVEQRTSLELLLIRAVDLMEEGYMSLVQKGIRYI
jgi:hypothetical protein